MSRHENHIRSSMIRFCLVGLAAGLVLVGAFSILRILWFQPARSEHASAVRVPQGGPEPAQLEIERTLRAHVEHLSAQIGPRSFKNYAKLEAAKLYLRSVFRDKSPDLRISEQNYRSGGQQFTNIEAELKGTQSPEEIILIGAHYDTILATPGADDNASGVAAVLALAEQFSGQAQPMTIRFVGFANEEPPWFQSAAMGSFQYARSASQEGQDIVAMLSLESIGYFSDEPGSQKYPKMLPKVYPSTANFVAVVGNLSSRGLAERVGREMEKTKQIPVLFGAFPSVTPGVGWSDHWSFWEFGYPAVMITGTAIYRNPNYHKPGDIAETLDYARLARTVKALRAMIVSLASGAQAG